MVEPIRGNSRFEISGAIPDVLLGQGLLPTVDARLEYLAGGSTGFPLYGQILLTKSIDDLTRDLGWRIYEMMLNDPTVASAFFVLATGILNGEFQVVPRHTAHPNEVIEKGSTREQELQISQETADFVHRQIMRLPRPIKQTSFEMLYAMIYGTKLCEKVFEEGFDEDQDRIVLKRLRTKRNDSWQFVVTPFGDIVGVRGLIVGGGLVDLPPEKFMIHTWFPQDGDPRGHSILRPAYNGWNLKLNCWPKLYKYLDRFGQPITVGTAAPDAPNEDEFNDAGQKTGNKITPTQALGQALNRLEAGSWIALRAGSKVELFQATGNGEQFLTAISLFKHEILEAILMTARSTLEAQHGSKADTQEAQHVVKRLIELGRDSEQSMYEHQLFHQLVQLNWGKPIADHFTPRCSMGEVETKDIETVLNGFTKAGYMLDTGQLPHIDKLLGLPVRKIMMDDDGQPMYVPIDQLGQQQDDESETTTKKPKTKEPRRAA